MINTSRLIVLTGASRGLGRALVDGFIAKGHRVAGCGRNRDGLESLARQYPSPNRFDAVDVANDAEVQAWAESILRDSGAPDLLINNAALINRSARLWELSAPEFDEVIRVNICGVANVIRHFLPAMIARSSGVIVNLSSGWGRSTSPDVAPYCATKFAIEGLTQALAQELPPGLAAIPVNPGIIDTDMLRSCFGSSAASYPAPADWAKSAIPFFLSLGPRHNGRSLSVE